jgi:hypothetical protein
LRRAQNTRAAGGSIAKRAIAAALDLRRALQDSEITDRGGAIRGLTALIKFTEKMLEVRQDPGDNKFCNWLHLPIKAEAISYDEFARLSFAEQIELREAIGRADTGKSPAPDPKDMLDRHQARQAIPRRLSAKEMHQMAWTLLDDGTVNPWQRGAINRLVEIIHPKSGGLHLKTVQDVVSAALGEWKIKHPQK